MNLLRKTSFQLDPRICVVAGIALTVTCLFNAYHATPLFDEPAHFASGVILGQLDDPSYFKVDPPLNKWITALATTFHSFDLPYAEENRVYGGEILLDVEARYRTYTVTKLPYETIMSSPCFPVSSGYRLAHYK